MRDPVNNISPLDGRYSSKVEELRPFFSEFALMKYRVLVEVEWFIYLSNTLKLDGTKVLKAMEVKELRSLYEYFDDVNANRVKEIESTTNHDVKAIEYFIKENLIDSSIEPYLEFVHFACTSEDINNLAYALMLRDAMKSVVEPLATGVEVVVHDLAQKYKTVPMMSRTHGQPATPTTLGKEFIIYLARLERQLESFSSVKIMGKINGAVGNFNAHAVAYPEVKWVDVSKKFIQQLGLEPNLYTTQIESHDFQAEIFDALKRFNTVLMDLNRDMWTYISLGYFKQRLKEGEVGSSTMPHKVNPIDFENSEGNLGIANALLEHFSAKLPVSRMQRDLTDSTVQRNVGLAIGYSVLSYKNCIQGLSKLDLNKARLEEDLENNYELLAEPIQTVMRRYKIEGAYEQLKALTRGKNINQATISQFIDNLKLPANEKKKLKSLTPAKYIGLAVELVDSYEPLFLK